PVPCSFPGATRECSRAVRNRLLWRRCLLPAQHFPVRESPLASIAAFAPGVLLPCSSTAIGTRNHTRRKPRRKSTSSFHRNENKSGCDDTARTQRSGGLHDNAAKHVPFLPDCSPVQ